MRKVLEMHRQDQGQTGDTVRRLRLRPDAVAWRSVGDEIVALDCMRSAYLAVNPSASVLWRLLAEGACRDELVAALDDGFAIGAGRATVDVDSFLADLARRGLVEAR
jgi:hypothetical protein